MVTSLFNNNNICSRTVPIWRHLWHRNMEAFQQTGADSAANDQG